MLSHRFLPRPVFVGLALLCAALAPAARAQPPASPLILQFSPHASPQQIKAASSPTLQIVESTTSPRPYRDFLIATPVELQYRDPGCSFSLAIPANYWGALIASGAADRPTLDTLNILELTPQSLQAEWHQLQSLEVMLRQAGWKPVPNLKPPSQPAFKASLTRTRGSESQPAAFLTCGPYTLSLAAHRTHTHRFSTDLSLHPNP